MKEIDRMRRLYEELQSDEEYIDDANDSDADPAYEEVSEHATDSEQELEDVEITECEQQAHTTVEDLTEWAVELGLNAINVEDTPTFERGNTRSHIDITWATNDITERIQDWKVMRGEFFTFYNHIYFEITDKTECRRRTKRVRRFLDKARCVQMLKDQFSPSEEKHHRVNL
ncbi:hypothetical protein QE152_g39303 [Popillia japonica]|uniref:Transposase n=1 Tax=Popillia japonica TaxID=7064 RepID=A0AAW1HUB4_POPJA